MSAVRKSHGDQSTEQRGIVEQLRVDNSDLYEAYIGNPVTKGRILPNASVCRIGFECFDESAGFAGTVGRASPWAVQAVIPIDESVSLVVLAVV
jgi:hypothetical protein